MKRGLISAGFILISILTMGQNGEPLLKAKSKALIDSTALLLENYDTRVKNERETKRKAVMLKSSASKTHKSDGTSKAKSENHQSEAVSRRKHSF